MFHKFPSPVARNVFAFAAAVFAVSAVSPSLRAQDKNVAPISPLIEEPVYLFNSGETFVDLFGAFVNTDAEEIGDVNGGGVGAGYFFNRYLALVAEGYLLSGTDQDAAAMGGLMVRLPMDDFCTAFYAYAEFGGTFGDETEPTFQFGAGFDVRLTDHVSFFADARGIQNRHTVLDHAEMFRVGLRFVF